ncbi:hypothetical protein BURMUCF1_0231 [Burkholderia multivorans ATCC BAA-247]|nr:hypothetical protein BURMUCF1_0231 [Burkholderia multivorans ATCC BAA-247]
MARRGRAWHGSTNAAAAVTRCAVIRERITHRRAPSSSGRRRVRAPKKEKAPEGAFNMLRLVRQAD